MNSGWQLWILRFFLSKLFTSIWIFSTGVLSFAQNARPDGTLGTQVQVNGNQELISGGVQRGGNLFQSFSQFNVGNGGAATFLDPGGVANILSRVTGNSRSEILGQLRTVTLSGGVSPANLFLINPNGIVFGSNASLNVGGSFVATTANAIQLENGDVFGTNPANPVPNQLLNVNPSAFLFNQLGAGSIINQSVAPAGVNSTGERVTGLRVSDGRSLLLVGGDINLEGGRLMAEGGRIELGSVTGPALVRLNSTSGSHRLGYESTQTFQDIILSGQSVVDASGQGGGNIQVQGRNIRLQDGSHIRVDTLGENPGGTLAINASGALEVIGTSANGRERSSLTAETRGDGNAGTLSIVARWFRVRDGAVVSTASSLADGKPIRATRGAAGTLTIQAFELLEVVGEGQDILSRLTSQTNGYGVTARAGDLTITTKKLTIQGGAQVAAGTYPQTTAAGGTLTVNASDLVEVFGTTRLRNEGSRITNLTTGGGDAKTLIINTRQLIVQNGGWISAGAVSRNGPNNLISGAAGTLIINALDSVEVTGGLGALGNPNCLTACLLTTTEGRGRGGDLTINTGKLFVQSGAQIASGTRYFSTGQGGNLTVNADLVQVIGESVDGDVLSRITNRTSGQGNVSNLTVNTRMLMLQDGGQITADTLANGTGGNLRVNASVSIEVTGKSRGNSTASRLSAQTNSQRSDPGLAGNLTIITPQLNVRNGAEISVSGWEGKEGDAGNLLIDTRELRLDQGKIRATTGNGTGGNITLRDINLLTLRNSSQISATAGTERSGRGNGGNLDIDARFIVGFPGAAGNIISANAFGGRGGNINITTQGIFGFPPLSNTGNRITASSQLGVQGNVTINRPDVDPSQGLDNLPETVVDASGLITRTCPTGEAAQSQLIVTGRGGIPPSPSDTLSTEAISVGPVNLSLNQATNPSQNQANNTQTAPATPAPVPATGWVRNQQGDITLVASAAGSSPLSLNNPLGCTPANPGGK
jgi:filamentous hemagglutinin family protein